MLCHLLLLIISHNGGIINPLKYGFISPSLGVKMKCELIGQVHTMAEITEAQYGDVSRSLCKDRNDSKSLTREMMVSFSYALYNDEKWQHVLFQLK